MEALISYVVENGLRASLRPNVSESPVPTATLGIVNKRNEGFGISAATYKDMFELLRLAHAVASEPQLEGPAPKFYTSICINANFGSMLHVDRYNDGISYVVAGGEYTGGELFVACESSGGHEVVFTAEADINSGSWTIAAGDAVKGRAHNIQHLASSRYHQS